MKKLIAFLATAALVVGCAGTSQEKAANSQMEMNKVKTAYIQKGIPAGLGIGKSKDQQIAYEKADQNARADLAKELESLTKLEVDNFKGEVSEQISEDFQSTSITRAKVVVNGATMTDVQVETTEDGTFMVYGVVSLKTSLVEEYIKMLEEQGKKAEAEKVRAYAQKKYADLDEKVK